MYLIQLFQRSKTYILLLFFCSCSSAPTWHLAQDTNSKAAYHSKKLLSPSSNPTNGIQLEFFKSKSELNLYLVKKHSRFPLQNDKVPVKITFTDHSMEFLADSLSGKQRIKMPKEALDCVILCLSSNQSASIKIGNQIETIHPYNFPEVFSTFSKNKNHLSLFSWKNKFNILKANIK